MKKYSVGLIIGRFQPFHNGHLYLLREALKISDKIIIGIGSSNISDSNNPWNFEKRLVMVEEVIKNEKLEGKVIKIVDIPDVPDDNEWLKITKEKAGDFDISMGNNDWVNGIFKNAGYKILRIKYFKRYINEGWRIRKLMKEGKDWKNRVPSYIIPLL